MSAEAEAVEMRHCDGCGDDYNAFEESHVGHEFINPAVRPCEREDCGKPRGICGHIDSAADFHPGAAFDTRALLTKIRELEAVNEIHRIAAERCVCGRPEPVVVRIVRWVAGGISQSSSSGSGKPSPRRSKAYSSASRSAPISASLLSPIDAFWASCASLNASAVCSAVNATARTMRNILGGAG